MAHELGTRRDRRVSYVSYVPGTGYDDDDELLALEEELENEPPSWKPNWFVRFVERFPYIVVTLMTLLAGGCAALLYYYAPVPEFLSGEDPTKGFETRGTKIHRRAWTLRNLYNRRDSEYFLQPNATQVFNEFNISPAALGALGRNQGQQQSRQRRAASPRQPDQTSTCPRIYMHDSGTYKFAIQPRKGDDLLTRNNLLAQCRLEDDLILPYVVSAQDIISLPRMILCTRNKDYNEDGCASLTDQDVLQFRVLLSQCAPFYYNNTLLMGFPSLPDDCVTFAHLINNVFKFMAPIDFYNPNKTEDRSTHRLDTLLTYVDFMEMDGCEADMSCYGEKLFHKKFEGRTVQNDLISVVALNVPSHMDVKSNLFSDYLIKDAMTYFSLALILIVLIMLVYTCSFVLMIATVINVCMSFMFACAVYFFVFRMHFFPFINLLAGLVLIAVGADDVFIFYDNWKQTRNEDRSLTMAQSLSKTYSHAALSIFVTSLTTACAFYTNVISTSITCIRCFGIFAGTAILINFVVMATWTPAVIILIEKVLAFLMKYCKCSFLNSNCSLCCSLLSRISDVIYGKFFPTLVNRAWFLWIFLLVGIGAGSSIIVFVTPKLQLPKSEDFQLFPASNVLENWDLNFAQKFPYQVDKGDLGMIRLYFLFGFEAKDDGNWLEPDDHGGDMTEDKRFNFSSKSTQTWLQDFCNMLRNQSFVDPIYRGQPCSLTEYGNMMKDYCTNPLYRPFIGDCCDNYQVPYSHYQVQYCIPGLQVLSHGGYNMMGDPIYDSNNNIKGFIMFAYTNLKMSMSYDEMHEHYGLIDRFAERTLLKAPHGLRSGFVSGRYQFSFYDLQDAIASGTYMSIGLSLALAFVIMFLVTMNLLITLYAILTIAGAITTTVACIVLLGWELNIIESITISLAVGLSIDFTIHYGVAYRLAKSEDSLGRVNESFMRVGSAVAMAALTTFTAGAAMMPSHVLAYIKLGIFLMLVMTFSWIYSTFFFQSICRIIGPRGKCCQIPIPCCKEQKQRTRPQPTSDDSFITF